MAARQSEDWAPGLLEFVAYGGVYVLVRIWLGDSLGFWGGRGVAIGAAFLAFCVMYAFKIGEESGPSGQPDDWASFMQGMRAGETETRNGTRSASGWQHERKEKSSGEQERADPLFLITVFSIMGHLAKSDGLVTRDEVRFALTVMDRLNVYGERRQAAQELFRRGRSPDFDLDWALSLLRDARPDRDVLFTLVAISAETAVSDGEVHFRERQLLRYICDSLGLSPFDLDALIADLLLRQRTRRTDDQAGPDRDPGRQGSGSREHSHDSTSGRRDGPATETQPDTTAESYRILQVDPDCSNAELKSAYRQMVARYHPDTLASKGLPEDMMGFATARTRRIREAWEHLSSVRGI